MIQIPAEPSDGETPAEVVILEQGARRVELPLADWAEILLFLLGCDWQPKVPVALFTNGTLDVTRADALELALVGRIVLEEAAKDPNGALAIDCDLAKLQEIVTMANEGAFQVCRQLAP